MAKKKKTTSTTHTTSDYDVVKFCAFIALAVAAIAACISFVIAIIKFCGGDFPIASRIVGICNTVSQVAMLVAVILPAWKFVKGKKTVYKALFWVAIIFLVLGLVGINLAI